MGGFTLPPGWAVVPGAPSPAAGGFALPQGWSVETPQQQPGALSRFGGALAENLIPEAIRHPSMFAEAPGALQDVFTWTQNNPDPFTSALGGGNPLLGAILKQFGVDTLGASKATYQDQMAKGNPLGAVLGATPFIGPPSAQVGEEIGQGNYAEAAGHATGLLAPFAAEGVGKAARAVTEPVGKAMAAGTVNSLIKPLEKNLRFGRNPGAGLVEEGIVARSLPKLKETTATRLEATGKAIEQKLNTPAANSKLIDIEPLLKPFDDAIAEAKHVGDAGLASRLEQIRDAPLYTDKTLVSPAEAAKIKTTLGKSTRWTGEAFDKDINQAKAAVYRGLNDAIDQAVPGVKKTNAHYADLLSALKSIERQEVIGQRAAMVNLMDVSSAGAGLLGGGPAGAAGLALGRRALGTTLGKTTLAQGFKGLGASPTWLAEVIRALGLGARAQPGQPSPQQ